MLNRRQFTGHALAAGLGSALLPRWSWAKTAAAPAVLWGPPVAPTLLLALAAKNPALQKAYPGLQAKTWRTPSELRPGIVNGTMPLTMVPSYVAANIAAHGLDVGLLNIMTNGLLYIIAKNDRIQTLDDLVGKKLVMPFKGDMPDLVLQALLKKAAIPREKITITYTATPPESLLLFLSGQADAALLPEPAVTMAQMKGKLLGQTVIRALDVQQLWGALLGGKPHIPQAGILVQRAFYRQQGAFLHALQAPLKEALNLAQTDPQKAAAEGSNVLGIPQNIMAKSIPFAHLTVESAPEVADDILAFFEVLYRLNPKVLGGKMPDKTLFWTLPQA